MSLRELEEAWSLRERMSSFQNNQAVRIFHGPGEGTGELSRIAIERFGSHAWVTEWEGKGPEASQRTREMIAGFLRLHRIEGGVWLGRPRKGVPRDPEVFFGEVPEREFEIQEEGLRFWIRLRSGLHPGLFLDHLPIRRWLRSSSRSWRVLNTFAYTGSLSVAAGMGGASEVTTLDLSKPTVRWAEANWAANRLEPARARFIAGDVFEWLPRLEREGQSFDCVILDPPSFSRGKSGSFSTSKDLAELHGLALDLLAPTGVLITSINSAQVTPEKMESEIKRAAQSRKVAFQLLHRVDLPPTFPTRFGDREARYLKGFVLRRS